MISDHSHNGKPKPGSGGAAEANASSDHQNGSATGQDADSARATDSWDPVSVQAQARDRLRQIADVLGRSINDFFEPVADEEPIERAAAQRNEDE